MGKTSNPIAKKAFAPFQIRGGKQRLPAADVIRTSVFGETVFFSIGTPRDFIQKNYHSKGVFYEMEELEIIRRAFQPGGRFIDIGANVGNHALFVAKFLSPSEVVVVEPNPVAYNVLFSNVLLNQLDDVFDMNWIGYGISDDPNATFGMAFRKGNVGAGRMVAGSGDITTVRVDDVVGDRHADFIKIDVEGMEMQVLNSMEATIERCRPRIFVEVDENNRAAFEAWVEVSDYTSVQRFKRYPENENHLLVHDGDENWVLATS
ncbi:FkbM family methyltransferase [Marivita sp.]|uniref:FkbM family methyltransferase n=1 Tax=Marivita sp. TaxID=2003365 RepID=UPI003F6BE379